MRRILITGGAGFIGTNLATTLAGEGHQVTVLDNLSPQVHGENPWISHLVRSVSEVATIVQGDVTSRDDLEAALPDQDIVIHLAAETGTGQSMYEVERYNRVNVGGTATLLDILANDESRTVSKVVVASSRSIYGEGRYRSEELGYVYPGHRSAEDMREGRFEVTYPGAVAPLELVPTTEDSRIHPSSVYAITKHAQEQLVMTVCPSIGVRAVALRYQNVYGPGQSLANPYTGILSIFSTLIRQGREINVFEDGLESRDFVYIDDVVKATVRAALDDEVNNHVVNVGSGVGTPVTEVVAALVESFGREVPVTISGNFRLGDIRHNIADLARAREVLRFEPEVSFREGVKRFVAWVESQEEVVDRGYERSLDEMRRRNLLK